MPPVIVFVGAGSCIFARRILVDLLSFADLRPFTLRLLDVDPGRLGLSERMARSAAAHAGGGVAIEATTDRARALDGADFVVSMFEPDGLEARRREVEVSISRGVPQSIGDTLGPAGVFKGIRTASVSLAVARDMERLCPRALLLNHVNPMAINCWAVSRLTRIACVGMCHGLEHTLHLLGSYLGLPRQPQCLAAGINHLCWLLTLRDGEEDLYPRLRAAAPRVREDDPIRFDLMEAFGYFVTESPYHVAEYLPYFRRRFAPLLVHEEEGAGRNRTMAGWAGAIIEPSAGPGGRVEPLVPVRWDVQMYRGYYRRQWDRERAAFERGEPVEISLSEEYAARVIHSRLTGTPRRVSLNVPNTGLVDNLAPGCCVEVPADVDGAGVHPAAVGELPAACAVLCQRDVDVQRFAVQALADEDPRQIVNALLVDPLTGACLEPTAIVDLARAIAAAEPEFLPAWVRP